MWGTMTARVLGVILRAASSAERLNVAGSMSATTGAAPVCSTAFSTAAQV